MAAATTIKEITDSKGKIKFQAQIYHKGIFFTSKTFESRALAVMFKEKSLEQVIKGELKSAAERRMLRIANSALSFPMTHWADEYVKAHAEAHSTSRLSDYALVGRLLANTTLRAFDGLAGAQYIEQLQNDWRTNGRLPRSMKPRARDAANPRPLAENSVRLRVGALLRLIDYARSKLPPNATFQMPALKDLFEFSLPPAHAVPRSRMPSDDEYCALLQHFGLDSPLGQFLRVIDEGGFRLGEVRQARGNEVQFFTVNGVLAGGVLELGKHKTVKKRGKRQVPLSRFAAELLAARKQLFGDGPLFPELGTTDSVCKMFDDACQSLTIKDLQIKDVRRAFINRNKNGVAYVDMVKIVGTSSLLGKPSQAEQECQSVVGHADIRTMAGYSQLDPEHLASVLTRTSRWPRIAAKLGLEATPCGDVSGEHTRKLLEELEFARLRLAQAGVDVTVTMQRPPIHAQASRTSGVVEFPETWALV